MWPTDAKLVILQVGFLDATSHEFQTLLKSDSIAVSLVSPGEV